MDESKPAEPPSSRTSEPDRFAWTGSQRRVLIALLAFLCCLLTVRYACNSRFVSDPQPQQPSRAGELADRIDPNSVDWEVLAAIPGLGDKRAKEIVQYRDDFVNAHQGQRAFNHLDDLLKVRGVGVGIANSMEPYLVFQGSTSKTSP